MMSGEDITAVKYEVDKIQALVTAAIECFDLRDENTTYYLCKITFEFVDKLAAFLNEKT